MLKKILFFSLLVLISSGLSAQTGNYFLSHYSPPDERIDFRSHDMVQDSQGEIYFASKAGVLEFDGHNWKLIPMPGAAYTLLVQGTEVLVGGITGGGKLSAKRQSPRTYQIVSEIQGIFSGVLHDGKAYFCSEDQLVVYSLATQLVESTLSSTSASGRFLGVFNLGEEVVVRAEKQGLLKVKDSTLVEIDFVHRNLIFSVLSPSRKSFLIGTQGNRVFILSDSVLKEVVLQEPGFLARNILIDGVWASENVLALGTLRGGVIFINVLTGATEEIVDYASGLPDNEVFSLMTDRNEGVWAAHEYGFTRIAPSIPFRSFDTYAGLQGNLLCAQSFQDKLYVGTTLGLFLLTTNKVNDPTMYEYQKVKSIQGKVNQLIEINESLFAGGVSGLFEVQGVNAKPVVKDPVRYVKIVSALNQILVSTMEGHVKTFDPLVKGWKETHLLDTLNSNVNHIFEDKLENVWLCGTTSIFKVETVENEITDIVNYPVQNPTQDEILGLAFGNDVYVVSSGQFKRFTGSGFEKYDSLSGGRRYFSSAGNFWFYDGAKWRTVERKFQSIKLEWLGIFSSLRYLAPDKISGGLWAITDNNQLYRFTGNSSDSTEVLYPLFLREVKGKEIKLTQEVLVEQSEGAFSFEFIRPAYIGVHATQYRYMVKGLGTQWSAWSSTNNVVPFSYLPAGTYQLAVQSKDVLGVVSNIEQVSFRVLPPYWKRWWFYALEFVVFSFLVSLSIRLSRSDKRYQFLSQVLTMLTVIMLIQFIQTAIYSLISIYSLIGIKSSPVVEFLIQVSIALLVFPVEMLARKAMQKVSINKYPIQKMFNDGEGKN
jgi:ligand-binding sensor domain-containing protein